ncbi:MAG TPA: hypothetical protein DCZ92_07785 [Elusimicrobia bacterium]|nr:MAG: hypothetical protein A2016_12840 [Elusimicrobia bacterium GWF2_62_30]HBA60707.1 hypothetical protein [Elusimicrobiota bacterium]
MRRYILCGIILLAAAAQGRAYEYEFFNAEQSAVLAADPGQPVVRSLYTRSAGKYFRQMSFWDVGIGGELPLVRATRGAEQVAGVNVRGDLRSRFVISSHSFDLLNADYIGALNLRLKKPFGLPGSAEFCLSHTSSHLGDEVSLATAAYNYRQINYSREVLRALYFGSLSGSVTHAYGAQYILRKDPATPRGRLALQYDISAPLGKRFLFDSDLLFNEEHDWAPDFTVQLGLKLGREAGQVFSQRLTLEFYDGYSRQGQFFDKRERHISIGITAHL